MAAVASEKMAFLSNDYVIHVSVKYTSDKKRKGSVEYKVKGM